MPEPAIGGVGLGLVWGAWVAMAVWPARHRIGRALLLTGLATLGLIAGVQGLIGSQAVFSLVFAAGLAAFVGYGVRFQLSRRRQLR